MGNEKLTDEELDDVTARIEDGACARCDGSARWHGDICPACDGTGNFALATSAMQSIVRELRAHRRAGLSETDRLALSYALDLVRDHGCKCGACRATTAERVLTRLVEQKP